MYQTPEERREHSRAEDKDLIISAIAGKQDAYKRLMGKYRSAIRRLIIRMVGYSPDVEDLTQEAFIKAFQSLSSFNDEFAFSTWLYKIATNNCIDHLRKRKLQTISIDKPLPGGDGNQHFELPDSGSRPDLPMLRRQRTLAIQQAIEALPDKYRQVIIMRHQQEMSYEDIAAELALPLGTVKAHIFRARELLYRRLRGKVTDD